MGVRKLGVLIHHSREAEVSKFHVRVSVQENVARLQISVHNFLREVLALLRHGCLLLVGPVVNLSGLSSAVAVVEGAHGLGEYFPDKVLPNVVLRPAAASYQLLKVASVAVFLNDENLGLLLVDNAVNVLDNVRMV